MADFFKSLWYISFSAVSLRRGTIDTKSSFCQGFGFLLYIIAFGMGVYLATNLGLMNNHHPIIGIVLLIVLVLQPITGFLHHKLFKKYSPELQKKSLERRYERQKEFDDFVTQLKEYSKSDKPSM